jgi:histidinol-phosphate aminotransferase
MCNNGNKVIKTNDRLKLINEYKPSKRTFGAEVKKLDWNECNLSFDEKFYKILLSSLSNINFTEYPNIHNDELLNSLSIYCNINKENIQIFNGSDSALHYIFATFLNKNTNVLIYYPNYSQIETYIKLYSDNLNFSKIIDPFDSHIYNFLDVENNDVIYLSNPNNPTGICIDPKIIEQLIIKYPNKLFIIDEAYYEFSKKSCTPLVKEYPNIIITRTFSKAFSLASIRLGYICANESLINEINKIRNTKEVNSFAQILGLTALNNINYINDRVDLTIENREKLKIILNENKIKYIDSDANFILIKIENSQTIINELLKQNILVRDRGMFLGLEDTIRITIGDWDDIEKIIKILLNKNGY